MARGGPADGAENWWPEGPIPGLGSVEAETEA